MFDFIGDDYVGKDFTAKDDCADRGIEIIYNKREHDYSTTQLQSKG
jgi:glycerol-3-phosphate cytidylyltransferase